MNFENKRFVTKGVMEQVSPLLQLFMWSYIEDMDAAKDYLQVFKLTSEGGKQKIIHEQEVPEYKAEYLIESDKTRFYHTPKEVKKEFKNKEKDCLLNELGLILDADENMKEWGGF